MGLLERSGELAALAAGVASARAGSGRLLIVDGPAGIGKTALMGHAGEAAADAGMRPLEACGHELERPFALGVARQLLEPVLHDGRRRSPDPSLLAGPACLAGALLDVGRKEGRTPTLPPGPDGALAAVHALYWLIANLARRSPVAILVDDAHWADVASLRLLAYLGRRVPGLPLLLAVALRPGQGPEVERLATTLRNTTAAEVLRPHPLSPEAGARLVRCFAPDAIDDVCGACQAATGGNPFLLREMAKAIEGREAPSDLLALELPRLGDVVAARAAEGPEGTLALARAVAVLGRAVPLRHAAHIAGLAAGPAAAAVDALVDAGVLAKGRPLDFCHPIIGAAIAARVPAGERATAHTRAARLLAEEDAAAERVAAHLLETDASGDAWTAEMLVKAGREAAHQGSPEAGVVYLRRALEEPPPAERRGAVLLDLGMAEVLAFDLEAGERHLRRGLELASDPGARLGAATMLAGIFGQDGRALEAVELLDATLARAAGADSALVGRVEANLVNIARNQISAKRRAAPRAAALLIDVRAGRVSAPPLLAAVAADMAMAGTDAEGSAALAERALSASDQGWDTLDYWPYVATRCLAIADRPAAARRALDAGVGRARERGSVYQLRAILLFRAEVAQRAGDLARAEADVREAMSVDDPGWRAGVSLGVAILMLALLERGEESAAAELARDNGLDGGARDLPDLYTNHLVLHARGRVRVARGEARSGTEDLLECGRRQLAIGEHNPAVLDWRSQAALALAASGERDRALILCREELCLARAFGAQQAIGIAQRASGLVKGGAEGLELLRRAADTLAGSSARLEHARALVDLGGALRRSGRRIEARGALRPALGLAHSCGATALEERAMIELHAAGARPRRVALSGPHALTPSERRIATLAADGQVNREIAAALYLSVRTVEFHLSGSYRKLGVSSRRELAGALRDGETDST